MDAHELRRVGEELAKALDVDGKPFFELKLQLGRLLSHLESEQRVTVRMEKQMDLHEKALFGDKNDLEKSPGAMTVLVGIAKQQKSNQKIHATVLGAVLSVLVIELCKLVFAHMP